MNRKEAILMKRAFATGLTILALSLACAGVSRAQGTYAPDEEGWVSLCDGQDLTGWHLRHAGESGWSVVDGVLTNSKASIDIISDAPLEDQELHVEFRVPKGGNSGVYLQSRYEVQVADSQGQQPSPGSCGSVYSKITASKDACKAPGEWQSYDIQFLGARTDREGNMVRPAWIKVTLNGEDIVEGDIDGATGGEVDRNYGVPGGLMLQGDHGPIEYRNIRYRPLKTDWAPEDQFTPLFDGKDLTGWKTLQTGHGTGGKWSVVDGAICGTQDPPGNGGILMTEKLYGDYEIRFELNPDWDIDSGFFMRSADDGRCYQSTVDYRPGGTVGIIYGEGIGGWSSPDPGWGRFYKPNTWNDARIIIEGAIPRIQVWLNGNKVTDYVDTEERLPAEGRIGLQVHGGGDWQGRMARFRNIRIRPIEAR